MTPLSDLIARLEGASGGSAELDAAIAQIEGHKLMGEFWMEVPNPMEPDYPAVRWVPAYTSSLDCALWLVSEGWWSISQFAGLTGSGKEAFTAEIHFPDREKAWGIQTTPALALCIASLRARQSLTPITDVKDSC